MKRLEDGGRRGPENQRRAPEPTPGGPPVVKLAGLPFADLGTDPGREFLGDALTEELIALLGRLQPESLRVIARTSGFRHCVVRVPEPAL